MQPGYRTLLLCWLASAYVLLPFTALSSTFEWDEPQLLGSSNPQTTQSAIALTASNSTFVAVWLEPSAAEWPTSNWTLLRSYSVDGGGTWSPPQAVFAQVAPETFYESPLVATNKAGTWLVAYHGHYALSTDDGTTFSKVGEIEGGFTGIASDGTNWIGAVELSGRPTLQRLDLDSFTWTQFRTFDVAYVGMHLAAAPPATWLFVVDVNPWSYPIGNIAYLSTNGGQTWQHTGRLGGSSTTDTWNAAIAGDESGNILGTVRSTYPPNSCVQFFTSTSQALVRPTLPQTELPLSLSSNHSGLWGLALGHAPAGTLWRQVGTRFSADDGNSWSEFTTVTSTAHYAAIAADARGNWVLATQELISGNVQQSYIRRLHIPVPGPAPDLVGRFVHVDLRKRKRPRPKLQALLEIQLLNGKIASTVQLDWFISEDNTYSADDLPIGASEVFVPADGKAAVFDFRKTLKRKSSRKHRFLIVRLEASAPIVEGNITNNVITFGPLY